MNRAENEGRVAIAWTTAGMSGDVKGATEGCTEVLRGMEEASPRSGVNEGPSGSSAAERGRYGGRRGRQGGRRGGRGNGSSGGDSSQRRSRPPSATLGDSARTENGFDSERNPGGRGRGRGGEERRRAQRSAAGGHQDQTVSLEMYPTGYHSQHGYRSADVPFSPVSGTSGAEQSQRSTVDASSSASDNRTQTQANHGSRKSSRSYRSRWAHSGLIPEQAERPGKGSQGDPRRRPKHRNEVLRTTPKNIERSEHTERAVELIERLSTEELECICCLQEISRNTPIWSCREECSTILDLDCVRNLASRVQESSNGRGTFRWNCPWCRREYKADRIEYRCFCGRRKDPEAVPGITPHSCGEPCGRSRGKPGSNCPHHCTELCHPGQCPPCQHYVTNEKCHCKKRKITRKCSEPIPKDGHSCGEPCLKKMHCGRDGHRCQQTCHSGPCGDCIVAVETMCYCGSTVGTDLCAFVSEDSITGGGFSCGKICGKALSCQKHICQLPCHPGPCAPCERSPSYRKVCACGKTTLSEQQKMNRKDCSAPIPSCGKKCGKPLSCLAGHLCESICGHESDCDTCQRKIDVLCACGEKVFNVPCNSDMEEIRNRCRCSRICGDKMTCKKHHCSRVCCPLHRRKANESNASKRMWAEVREIQSDLHKCNQFCEKVLNCGQHHCDLSCGHRGTCGTCGYLVYEPLTCVCGASSIPPPVRCGTEPPTCDRQCTRPRDCPHPCPDPCHLGDCPPCNELVNRECNTHGESRLVKCFIKNVTCGRPCSKPLPCGMHACRKYCHVDSCVSATAEPTDVNGGSNGCDEICGNPREPCGHPCGSPCHGLSECPTRPCLFPINVRCKCGRQQKVAKCLAEVRDGVPSAPETEIAGECVRLDCDEECERLLRNERFAEAIGLESGEVGDEEALSASSPTEKGDVPLSAKVPEGDIAADAQSIQAVGELSQPAIPARRPPRREIIKGPFSDFLMDFAKREQDVVLYAEKCFVDAQESAVKLRPMCGLHRAFAAQLATEYKLSIAAIGSDERVLVVSCESDTAPITPSVLLSAARKHADAKEKNLRQMDARRRLLVGLSNASPLESIDLTRAKLRGVAEQCDDDFPAFEIVEMSSLNFGFVGGSAVNHTEIVVEFAEPSQVHVGADVLRQRKSFVVNKCPQERILKSFVDLVKDPRFQARVDESPRRPISAWGQKSGAKGEKNPTASAWGTEEAVVIVNSADQGDEGHAVETLMPPNEAVPQDWDSDISNQGDEGLVVETLMSPNEAVPQDWDSDIAYTD